MANINNVIALADKIKNDVINSRNAIIARGGSIEATAGSKDLPSAILNIPPDAAFSTVIDSSTAKTKSVPANSISVATLNSISGKTYRVAKRNEDTSNLFPLPNETTEANGLTVFMGKLILPSNEFRGNGLDLFHGSMPLESPGAYTIDIPELHNYNGLYSIGIYNLNSSFDISTLPFTFYPGEDIEAIEWVFINIYDDIDTEPLLGAELSIMLNPGNTAEPFVPYSVYELRDTKVTEIVSHGAQLLPYPFLETTKTRNGITFTDNGDGTVTANGTATAQSYFILGKITLPVGSYFLSGAPNTGQIYLSGGSVYKADNGNGVAITLTTEGTYDIAINIAAGVTVDNLVYKPMLNYGSTAVPRKPYRDPISYPIPEALQGTGKGLEGYSDTVDLVKGKETNRIRTYTFNGTEGWQQSGARLYLTADGTTLATPCIADVGLCKDFNLVSFADRGTAPIGSWCLTSNGAIQFITNVSSITEWRAFLASNPITIVYAVADPTETDISTEVFKPFVQVEGSGSIEIVTNTGDNAPTTFTFEVKTY